MDGIVNNTDVVALAPFAAIGYAQDSKKFITIQGRIPPSLSSPSLLEGRAEVGSICESCNKFQKSCKTHRYTATYLAVEHSYLLKSSFMPLLNVLIVLVVVGVILWLVNSYIPMDRKIKNILNVVVVIAVILWLLQAFGLIDSFRNVRI